MLSDFRDKRVCLQGVAAISLPGPLARASQALVPPHSLPTPLAMQLPTQLLGNSRHKFTYKSLARSSHF